MKVMDWKIEVRKANDESTRAQMKGDEKAPTRQGSLCDEPFNNVML